MSKPKAASTRWPLPPRTAAVLLVIAFLIVVSTALADEGAMMRRNTSNTPAMETEQSQMSVAQFFIPAQRANGTLVSAEAGLPNEKTDDTADTLPGAIQYYGETNVPRDFSTNDDQLMDERTIAKPIVVTYNDQVETDSYTPDGIPDNTQAAVPTSIGGELAKAVDDAFDAEALASGGAPDPEHHVDAFASVSFDDGETWSRVNLSESALKSSFTLKDGTEFPGNVDTVKHAVAGNKIVVVWTSMYAQQGSPRYSLKATDAEGNWLTLDGGTTDDSTEAAAAEYLGLDDQPVKYEDLESDYSNVHTLVLEEGGELEPVPLDIWGVAGAQKSIDYETYMLHGLFPFAEVGEAPYRTIWTARGVIQKIASDIDGDDEIAVDEAGLPTETIWSVKWRKPERLTSGTRDAYYTAIDGAEGAGFGIVWQEDPDGLRPGAGEGPGEGWSGAVANHKTDMWYSFLRWEDFDKVENPLVLPTAVLPSDEYTGLPATSDYLQTPDEVDAIGWDVANYTTLDSVDVITNKPQVFERFSMPQRISDNNNVLVTPLVTTEGEVTTGVTPSYTDDGKLTNIYAWLDRDGDLVPDLAAGGWTWVNSQTTTITNAVTEDGRLLNGQTASTRCRMMMEGYDKYIGDNGTPDDLTDDYVRSAWVILGYEETKGLGPGHPDAEDTGDGQDEEAIEPPDLGKNVKADTFEFDSPSYAKPGHIINAPDLTNPGYGEVMPYTGLIENDKGELQYATPIARRPSLFTNPIIKAEPVDVDDNPIYGHDAESIANIDDFVARTKMQPGMTSAVMLYKEGTMRQGGPADIFLRRWVVPMTVVEDDVERAWDAHIDNPFNLANLVSDLPADYSDWADGTVDVDTDGDGTTEAVPICPIWLKNDDGTYSLANETYNPERDGVFDGWDTSIITKPISVDGVDFDTTNAYPSVDGLTSEYYPNGVMVRGAQNLSSTTPLDIRLLEPGDGTGSAAETVPSWHLDLMPDLAAKVEDGTLSFTDCASCHPDSWGASDDTGEPVHGITERVWWWTQIGATATQTAEDAWDDVIIPDSVDLTDDAQARIDAAIARGGNNYDFHWSNGFELSKGHRGYIDGNEIVMMFGYAPNWLISSHGKEPINLFIRRSFDGGATWSTTPATTDTTLVDMPYDADADDDGVLDDVTDTDGDGLSDQIEAYAAGGVSLDGVPYDSLYTATEGEELLYSQIQGTGAEDSPKVFFYDETYAAGDFERMRNVSQFYSSASTIIDPRYAPTNNRRQTAILRQLMDDQTEYSLVTGSFAWAKLLDPVEVLPTADSPLGEGDLDTAMTAARVDDLRDPSKNFAVFESGNTAAVADGAEATAENLYYSRATEWGDNWEEVVWYPSINNPDGVAASWWDWLENAADVCSGEAAVASSPGGQCFYAVWNEWKEDDDEHMWDSDAVFRRCYWVPDAVEPEILTVTDVDELMPDEGEVVTLTASSTYTIGDEPASDDQLEDIEYAWDLDANGSFETLGQTVTMKATGAMQVVVARAADQTTGADGIDSIVLHGEVTAPRVWNVKLVKGDTGLAGTKVALSANFRSPGQRRKAPAPADFDDTVTAVIDWGDGTIEPGAIASKNDGKGSQRFVVGEHKYKTPGLYTVKVTATDAYGKTGWNYLEYAVIVHRKAGALSIKGTFDDPNGAGVATVAANVKYKVKGKYPSGKVAFVLGETTFVSEKLDWMAVHGRKAWVRGQGQLNGVGGYEFLIAVVDDRKNVNDLIRVKIWKANGKMEQVVYDSQPGAALDALAVTELKDGKITIPLFKGKSWMRIRGLIK